MRTKATQLAILAAVVMGNAAWLPGTAGSLISAMPASAAPTKQGKVGDWFQSYDEIRHQAQMSDAERERSKTLLTQGMASSIMQSPGAAQDKAAAKALLSRMVGRYQKASAQVSALHAIPETKKLQEGYGRYFQTAEGLFSDYLKVQDNLFATDGSGNGIVGGLAQRKADLESLDATNKELDAKLRSKYGVAPYAY